MFGENTLLRGSVGPSVTPTGATLWELFAANLQIQNMCFSGFCQTSDDRIWYHTF